MPKQITIEMESETLKAELNDSATAQALAEKLPLTVSMSRWGDEYYGSCGLDAALGDGARDVMEVGELAYWPTGDALCIFFGPTPVSMDDEPRAASAVNPLGRLLDDPTPLKSMPATLRMTLS